MGQTAFDIRFNPNYYLMAAAGMPSQGVLCMKPSNDTNSENQKKSDENQADPSAPVTELVEFWIGECERAGKDQPTGMWNKAQKRYAVEDSRNISILDPDKDSTVDFPVVNDLRNHVEASMSYLDQTRASFSVTPSRAYTLDQNKQKEAQCEQAYLDYIWGEQKMQPVESMKLHSALLRNIGVTFPYFDFKKWMPDLKYIPAERVRFDPDCKGIWPEANWCAYYEDVSVDVLRSLHDDLTPEELKTVRKLAKSSLTDDQQKEASEEKKAKHSVVRLWHIFAQNDAAIRVPDESKLDEKKSFADELQLNVPRRYMQAVGGLKRFLIDEPKWPFDLDRKELPFTTLQFNPDDGSLYGFTDHAQMERTDEMSDAVMTYIEQDCKNAAIRKFGGPDAAVISQEDIKTFIESPETTYQHGLVDEAGKAKVIPLNVGQINPGMKDSYETIHEEAMRSSGQSELLAENLADLKEVTALGVKYHESKLHQRVNRRLSGPRGYESSILEDAVKILEIAHQKVPRYSVVAVKTPMETPDIESQMMVTQEKEILQSLPWDQACSAIKNGGTLVKLGVDSIVGPELAEFWLTTDDVPMIYFKLSTSTTVVPGSTRSITSSERVADLSDFYINILWPTIYQPTMNLGKAAKFVTYLAQLSGSIDKVEQFIPTDEEIQQSMQQQQEVQQQQANQQMELEKQKMDMQMQVEGQKLEMEKQKMGMELQSQQAKMQMEQQGQQMELQGKAVEQQMNMEGQQQSMQMEQRKAEMNAENQSKVADQKLKTMTAQSKLKKTVKKEKSSAKV
jgi:hypothetical protein